METKKITKKKFDKIVEQITDGNGVSAGGKYTFKGVIIHIIPDVSPAEKRKIHRAKKKSAGLCTRYKCQEKVIGVNPITGKKWSQCPEHRQDNREAQARNYSKVTGGLC